MSSEPELRPITFRPLGASDMAMMHRWLNQGETFRWYGQNPTTLEEITAEYMAQIEGGDPTRGFIVSLGDESIGYIQTYRPRDWPEYWGHAGLPPDAAGSDMFIGEEAHLYRGLGTQILRLFLEQIVFADPEVSVAIIDPDPNNRAAIRCYEKVGFRFVRRLEPPVHNETTNLMTLPRERWEAQ